MKLFPNVTDINFRTKAKAKILTIDLSKECTIKTLSEELRVSTQVISNWVKRGQIKSRKIEELNDLVLVTRGTHELKG